MPTDTTRSRRSGGTRPDAATLAGWTSVVVLALQALGMGRVAYLERAVDPAYGWGAILVIYTAPFVALVVAVWGGLAVARRGWSRWWWVAAGLGGITASVASVVAGVAGGYALAG